MVRGAEVAADPTVGCEAGVDRGWANPARAINTSGHRATIEILLS